MSIAHAGTARRCRKGSHQCSEIPKGRSQGLITIIPGRLESRTRVEIIVKHLKTFETTKIKQCLDGSLKLPIQSEVDGVTVTIGTINHQPVDLVALPNDAENRETEEMV